MNLNAANIIADKALAGEPVDHETLVDAFQSLFDNEFDAEKGHKLGEKFPNLWDERIDE